MNNKHKFFILGIIIGVTLPFSEHVLDETFDANNLFVNFLLFGQKIWHYVFLYVVVINSIILYVKRFRIKINPQSRIVFLFSGVSSGFALISIVAATVEFFR